MIMIIAIIYIFLSYVIFDQQLKITFRKSSGLPHTHTHTPEKIHSPLITQYHPKNPQIASPPFLPNFFRQSA